MRLKRQPLSTASNSGCLLLGRLALRPRLLLHDESNKSDRLLQERSTLRIRVRFRDAINAWFCLMRNIVTKYNVVDIEIYNFNEMGFMISVNLNMNGYHKLTKALKCKTSIV